MCSERRGLSETTQQQYYDFLSRHVPIEYWLNYFGFKDDQLSISRGKLGKIMFGVLEQPAISPEQLEEFMHDLST